MVSRCPVFPKPRCPVDGECPALNDTRHQAFYRHMCTFKPCPYVHTFPSHALAFIHEELEGPQEPHRTAPRTPLHPMPVNDRDAAVFEDQLQGSYESIAPQVRSESRQKPVSKKKLSTTKDSYAMLPKAVKLREERDRNTLAETKKVKVGNRTAAWEAVGDVPDGQPLFADPQHEIVRHKTELRVVEQQLAVPATGSGLQKQEETQDHSALFDELQHNRPTLRHVSPPQAKLPDTYKADSSPASPPVVLKTYTQSLQTSYESDKQKDTMIEQQQNSLDEQKRLLEDQTRRQQDLEEQQEHLKRQLLEMQEKQNEAKEEAYYQRSEDSVRSSRRPTTATMSVTEAASPASYTIATNPHSPAPISVMSRDSQVVLIDYPDDDSPQSANVVYIPTDDPSPPRSAPLALAPHRPVITPSVLPLPQMTPSFARETEPQDALDEIRKEREQVLKTLQRREIKESENKVVKMSKNLPHHHPVSIKAKKSVPTGGSPTRVNSCVHCRGAVPINASFCIHCGKGLTVALSSSTCRGCNTHLSANAMFCTKCGTPTDFSLPRTPSSTLPHSTLLHNTLPHSTQRVHNASSSISEMVWCPSCPHLVRPDNTGRCSECGTTLNVRATR
eukprot:TRINITY_DN21945_c0_g1_i1.p1 TRINITY_DN21945_c0_g1~~TRINITY_DN21945_c0_g1_i1.p1  ORF type:complete len:645 (+),score=72.37 TRINITY_DN21945_c0_g1_i1:90-1937(+)